MKANRCRTLTILACLAVCSFQGALGGAEPGSAKAAGTAPGVTAPRVTAPRVTAPRVTEQPRERGRWRRTIPNGKNESAVRSAFQRALEKASAATVRVLSDGKEVALGAVVEAHGHIVTKASVLTGKITCRFKDGTVKDAENVGRDKTSDLALLRVEATNLPTVTWRDGGPPPPGSLVATAAPADQPIAVGVVSSDLRTVFDRTDPPRTRGWLGITLGAGLSGLALADVAPGSPAAWAGMRVGDEVEQIDGVTMKSAGQVVETVGGHAPDETITLVVHRSGKDEDVEILRQASEDAITLRSVGRRPVQ